MLSFDDEIINKLESVYRNPDKKKKSWFYEILVYGTPYDKAYGRRVLELFDITRFDDINPFFFVAILRSGYANYSWSPEWNALRDKVAERHPEIVSKMSGLFKPYEKSDFFNLNLGRLRNRRDD